MCQYLNKFHQNFSETVFPLRNLTKGNSEFLWSNNDENTFNLAKDLIASAAALRYYILLFPELCKWMRMKTQLVACCYKTIGLSV